MKKLILCLSIIFMIGLFYGPSFAVDGERNAPSVYITGLEINGLPIAIAAPSFYWFSAYGDFTNWIPFQEDKVSFANGEAFISIETPVEAEQSYFVMHPSGYVFTSNDNFKARLSFRNYSSSIEEGAFGNGFGFYLWSWSQKKVVGIQLDPDGKAYSTWTMGNLLPCGIYSTPDNIGTFIIEKIGNLVNLYIEGKEGPIRIKTYENEISGNDIVIGINLWAKDAEDPTAIVDDSGDSEDGQPVTESETTNPAQDDTDGDGIGDVSAPDANNDPGDDGAQGTIDECPSTPLGEIVDNDGCSVWQYCPDGIEEAWKNHGSYVRCVAHEANQFVEEGIISEQEKGDIVSEAAKSDVGKKIKPKKSEEDSVVDSDTDSDKDKKKK